MVEDIKEHIPEKYRFDSKIKLNIKNVIKFTGKDQEAN